MGSRFVRRAVRRRSARAASVASASVPDGCRIEPSVDDAARMSCPAPFCPPGGAVYCQPETATPVDCGHAHCLSEGLLSEGKRHGDDPNRMQHCAPCRERSRRVAVSSSEGNHALQAWNVKDNCNVNKFTSKKADEEKAYPPLSHPLAQAVGYWQRQASLSRAEALRVSSRTEVEESSLPATEGGAPLPCLPRERTERRDGRREEYGPDDNGRSYSSSFRQGAQEELRAWRRPTRRQTSGQQVQNEAVLSERRLNKVIADAGYCSRRKADELIFDGRVSVNGEVERHAGRRISPNDSVSVDGRPITQAQRILCLMLHKPVHVVSTAADPQGRQTVLSLVAHDYPGIRLFPVGRLDYFSEGLILLTNDGRLAQRLMHPRHHLPKYYEVLVRNVVTQKALQTMRSGMRLAEGEVLRPVDVTARSTASGCTLLRMVLRQGVNRQIRRMCRDLGLTILRLRRVAIGPLQLGKLAPGHYRPLEENELAALRQAVDMR